LKIFIKVIPYKQETESSCLPACVRMVLSFLGQDVDEKRLRLLLKTKGGGTSPINVLNVSEIGFKALFYSDFPEELYSSIDNEEPCIVFLWTGWLSYWKESYMHAVVVVGYDDEYYHVLDPYFDNHNYKINKQDFLNAWGTSNYLLIKIIPSN